MSSLVEKIKSVSLGVRTSRSHQAARSPPMRYSNTSRSDHHRDHKSSEPADLHENELKQYSYLPLKRPDHIRILVLQPPETVDKGLQCTLEEVALDEGAAYTALSYSWALEDGDASTSEVLDVDGRFLAITKNLFNALLRLRTIQPKRLWVDAACIDQQNLKERNSQVAQMARIFGTAERVVAWLGEFKKGDARFAADMVAEAHDPRDSARLEDGILYLTGAFGTLLECRYFQRRWVVQELHFARDIVIRWSQYECTLGEFRQTLMAYRDNSRFVADRIRLLLEVPVDNSERSSLTRCLSAYQEMECTDPLDRLYSLLSVEPSCPLRPDYGMSVGQMGQEFAFNYLHRYGYVRTLLRNARGSVRLTMRYRERSEPEYEEGVPSWATNLHRGFVFLDSSPLDLQERNPTHKWPTNVVLGPPKIVKVWLYEYGTCSAWRRYSNGDCAQSHGYKYGFRVVVQSPWLEYRRVRILGLGYDSQINEGDLATGDLICSVTTSEDWAVVLRPTTDFDETFRIVGVCRLETWSGEIWRPRPDTLKGPKQVFLV